MSDKRDPNTDQAAPVPNDNKYIQEMVIDDIEERIQFGINKYGTGLQAHNGRDMLLDAYEEALDLCIYLRGALEERKGHPKHTRTSTEHGPDFCKECSQSISDWVAWPCSPAAVVIGTVTAIRTGNEWKLPYEGQKALKDE